MVVSDALPGNIGQFCCPLVLESLRARSAANPNLVYVSRFRSVTVTAPVLSDVERLANSQTESTKFVGVEQYYTIQFDIATLIVARSASVIDWSDPKKKLPSGGLKFFRARMERNNGDQIDTRGWGPGCGVGPVGEVFWGTGSRPAVLTGGVFMDQGSTLAVCCVPRLPDLEIDLGFWCIEERKRR